jgi:hypothetical protein
MAQFAFHQAEEPEAAITITLEGTVQLVELR